MCYMKQKDLPVTLSVSLTFMLSFLIRYAHKIKDVLGKKVKEPLNRSPVLLSINQERRFTGETRTYVED